MSCQQPGSLPRRTIIAARHAYTWWRFPNTLKNRAIIKRHLANIARCSWVTNHATVVARPIDETKPMGPLNIAIVEKSRADQSLNSRQQSVAKFVAKWMQSLA